MVVSRGVDSLGFGLEVNVEQTCILTLGALIGIIIAIGLFCSAYELGSNLLSKEERNNGLS
ncbi:hypothetical protein LCGC14_0547330 [marine sediment metagenome]|uniref:Uncharacterized protein n=1 Tax=marine sediment metagenome TaxID=412755 RepID=A0A0F9UCE7_9ZZZZ